MNKTFREIMNVSDGNPVEVSIVTDDGLTVTASCFTDDDAMMDEEATFTVMADWEITQQSPIKFCDVIRLGDKIVDAVGGVWSYDAADLSFSQAHEESEI